MTLGKRKVTSLARGNITERINEQRSTIDPKCEKSL